MRSTQTPGGGKRMPPVLQISLGVDEGTLVLNEGSPKQRRV